MFQIILKGNIGLIKTVLEIEEIERRCDKMISLLATGDKSKTAGIFQHEKITDFDKLAFCEK